MADLAQGLPFYTHMLARESALNAVMNYRTHITMGDLEVAIREAVTTHGETNLTLYNDAVTAPRGKYFKPVLLACALAEKDEKGFFYATNIVEPLRAITGKPLEIPAFAQHLKDFLRGQRPNFETRRSTVPIPKAVNGSLCDSPWTRRQIDTGIATHSTVRDFDRTRAAFSATVFRSAIRGRALSGGALLLAYRDHIVTNTTTSLKTGVPDGI